VADEVGQRQVGGALLHVRVLAGREGLEEADDATEPGRGHAGEAEGGAAAGAREPLLVVLAHLRRLERGIVGNGRRGHEE
jgi:hypothetical protein